MPFIYIIKHNLKGRPIFVKDLGPDGWYSLPPKDFSKEDQKIRRLHHTFTEEQVKNSIGLKQSLTSGWFEEVEIKFNTDMPQNTADNDVVNGLKSEIGDLKTLLSQLLNNQSSMASQQQIQIPQNQINVSSPDMEMLAKIAKDLKDIKAKTIGIELEGYEELSPAMAALQARKDSKIQIIKDSQIKLDSKEIDLNMDDLLDNLDLE